VWKLHSLSSCQYTHSVTRRLLGPHDTLLCVLMHNILSREIITITTYFKIASPAVQVDVDILNHPVLWKLVIDVIFLSLLVYSSNKQALSLQWEHASIVKGISNGDIIPTVFTKHGEQRKTSASGHILPTFKYLLFIPRLSYVYGCICTICFMWTNIKWLK